MVHSVEYSTEWIKPTHTCTACIEDNLSETDKFL